MPKTVAELAEKFPLEVASNPGDANHRTHLATAITGIASDNRDVEPGEMFAALPGLQVHGAKFATDATTRGATVILTDHEGAAISAATGVLPTVPVLVAKDVRKHFGPIAAHIYGFPAAQMRTFAITGTNGKTTTAYMLQYLLTALGLKTGLIGTVEMRSGDKVLPSKLTTPDAADLQAIIATMAEDNVQALAMEVSSHALALHRVDGVVYSVAGFTNLSQDHLDYHKTLADYFAAKALLFNPDHAQRGVVLIDDGWARKLAQIANIPVTTVQTEYGDAPANTADWVVSDVHPEAGGSAFTLSKNDGIEVIKTHTTLPGTFNVQNAALALVMVLESGVSVTDLTEALERAGGVNPIVPGRMETINRGVVGEPLVIVDFAHNTEALREALGSLKDKHGTGKLVVLFGAAGERDQGKRPAMGEAAVAGADVVYLTDDDPHGEDAAHIRNDVRVGIDAALAQAKAEGRAVEFHEIGERRDAIHAAIAAAAPGDTVLLAGRGHETIQQVGHEDRYLDDRIEARAALKARAAGAARMGDTGADS